MGSMKAACVRSQSNADVEKCLITNLTDGTRENTAHLNSASPSNQGEPEWRKEVKGQSKGERRAFGEGHEEDEGNEKKTVDCAVGDCLELRGDIREAHDVVGDKADGVECQIIYQADGSAYILESQILP
ncbi:hypothetical protein QTP70_007348 [Hemibagrus guttatus]|uniref:Uncharacterized protein n=1 Tax=Hemibagrus guttatus TaxID=175788 RepID=A0AAE0RBQ7_9TELE|nr:hypothetical protein QTP70_007348 [Hemibagrus guttatus]